MIWTVTLIVLFSIVTIVMTGSLVFAIFWIIKKNTGIPSYTELRNTKLTEQRILNNGGAVVKATVLSLERTGISVGVPGISINSSGGSNLPYVKIFLQIILSDGSQETVTAKQVIDPIDPLIKGSIVDLAINPATRECIIIR